MADSFKMLGNYGRLGNQLFQYAAMKSFSLKREVEFVLPKDSEHRLSLFEVTEDRREANNSKVYAEPHFHFDDNFFSVEDGTDFLGYFQSDKYFKEFSKEIKASLTIKDKRITDYATKYVENIRQERGTPVVSLHNRRGDNVPAPYTSQDKVTGVFRPDKEKYHPLLSSDYISAAMSTFSQDVTFLVFSDTRNDISWCKEHIKGDNVIYSENHPDIVDFSLQSACDHNIIANSSFSWWSAWLNGNEDKIVVSPSQWFGEAYAGYILKDLYPTDWIII